MLGSSSSTERFLSPNCHLLVTPMQALRWATPPHSQSSSQLRSVDGTASSSQQAKGQVTITLLDANYEPAAMAVLKGLYQVKPWIDLLPDLTPQQQVQAAVLADVWQLSAASEAAVGVLQKGLEEPESSHTHESDPFKVLRPRLAAEDSSKKLSAVVEQLLSLAAVPDSLLPVLEVALLRTYGDLEAVWNPIAAGTHASRELQDSILLLPLQMMMVLLASDKLKVKGLLLQTK
jgi:hypothetical protein